VHDLPIEVLDDPVWARSGHKQKGRDGCRVPIPWSRDGSSFGFGVDGSWLPQPEEWGGLSVEAQDGVPGSTLEMYRSALRLRSEHLVGDESLEWVDSGPTTMTFRRGGGVTVVVNFGQDPIALPMGEVLLSSSDLVGGRLPPDSAAWVATAPTDGSPA
ncbi:MAG TPA: DUF3459 domain-containing protein, partial [Acidimicrobiia bacterium]